MASQVGDFTGPLTTYENQLTTPAEFVVMAFGFKHDYLGDCHSRSRCFQFDSQSERCPTIEQFNCWVSLARTCLGMQTFYACSQVGKNIPQANEEIRIRSQTCWVPSIGLIISHIQAIQMSLFKSPNAVSQVCMELRLLKPMHIYAGVAAAVLFGWLIVLFIISYLSFK